MRNGNALANAGGAELFTLQQRLEDHAVIDGHLSGHGVGQFLQQLFLVRRLETGQNRLLVDEGIQGHAGRVP